MLGFEDIYRPDGDNDFNDLLFTVEVSPFTAIDGVNTDGSTDSKYEPLVQEKQPRSDGDFGLSKLRHVRDDGV